MSDFTKKSGLCLNCRINTPWTLHRKITVSGSETFAWVCDRCNRFNPNGAPQFWIPKDTIRAYLTQEQIDVLPLLPADCSVRCVRCGSRTAELHHWAPKAIFGDKECEYWPKDYLCKTCHDAWHKLVTPQLNKTLL